MSTKHFNIFNTGESSFFTPGVQLANIAKVTRPDVKYKPHGFLSCTVSFFQIQHGLLFLLCIICLYCCFCRRSAQHSHPHCSCFWNLEGRWMLCTGFSASTPQKYDRNMRMCISITGYHQSLETRRMLKSQFFRTQDDQRRLPGAYASGHYGGSKSCQLLRWYFWQDKSY